MDKKTSRKNNTGQVVNYPDGDKFWTIKDLHKLNPQFGPEITLRVRLAKAIKLTKTVAVIGDKMNSHGRPEMVCAVCQKDGKVKASTIAAAKAAGIRCGEPTQTVVTNINPTATKTSADAQPTVNINPAVSNKTVTV